MLFLGSDKRKYRSALPESIDIRVPDSPRLDCSGSPPSLNPATLSLLDDFLSNKAEEERRFQELMAEQEAGRIAGLQTDDNSTGGVQGKPMMNVDEYRRAFGEDWRLSQFWYSSSFANRLADLIDELEPSLGASIGFICPPTAFVAFQHLHPRPGTRLLEVDQRFAVLASLQYVPYDMNEPVNFPAELKESFDLVVVDPPFLNEVTNAKACQTLRQVLRPTGKLMLITSTSVEDVIEKLYDVPPLGPMKRTELTVEHGQLANDFACWGSWEGAGSFGAQ